LVIYLFFFLCIFQGLFVSWNTASLHLKETYINISSVCVVIYDFLFFVMHFAESDCAEKNWVSLLSGELYQDQIYLCREIRFVMCLFVPYAFCRVCLFCYVSFCSLCRYFFFWHSFCFNYLSSPVLFCVFLFLMHFVGSVCVVKYRVSWTEGDLYQHSICVCVVKFVLSYIFFFVLHFVGSVCVRNAGSIQLKETYINIKSVYISIESICAANYGSFCILFFDTHFVSITIHVCNNLI